MEWVIIAILLILGLIIIGKVLVAAVDIGLSVGFFIFKFALVIAFIAYIVMNAK